MSWSETWYTDDVQTHAETTDNKLNNPENGTQNMVHSTTDFLAKFDWEENNSSLVSDCIKEIQVDTQLKTWFENLLKSGISDDFIDKIKQELEENRKAGLDEETLKFLLTSLIAETIEWWFKIGSSTYVETLNQINQEEDEAVRQEDKAVQYEWNNIDTKNDNEAQYWREEALRQRLSLNEKYPNLWEQTNENSEKYSVVKNQLENNWVLSQLKELGHDDNFINDYILVQTTLQELKSNPTNYEHDDISTFDKIVKSLDNACNIADTNLNSFSSENVTQTRHELFNSDIWNGDLIEAKQSNLKSRDYKEMFPDKTEEEMVQIYWKFLPNNFKRFLDEYNDRLNNNKLDQYRKTDECKNWLDAINNVKMSIDNKTKDLMEELCIISQIKWMYMCMWEWDNFDLNKAKEIKSKNWVLTLNGHIDWVNFAIRQDTNNPDAKLQTYKKIVKKDGNTFNVGWEDNFVDSNFILPTQSDIFKLAVESVNSDWALNDAESPKDYVKKVQERFMLRVDNMYLDTKYVHHYMKEQVKWEKIVDNSLKLIKQVKPSIENVFSNVNQTTNNDLYNFVKILNFNIENSTDYEKDKLNFCIDKIREVINNYRTEEKSSGLYSHDISNYLENDTWIDWKWNENKRLWLISGLFTHFNENPIDKSRVGYEWGGWLQTNMIINDLYIQLHDKPKEKEKQQNRDLVAEKERTDAEYELNSALGNMA